ncbi:MAG: hypothetical protein HYW47_06815 [Deltaproteobacteria bacterium]|nr:hypothetical protein [Deltaproteobacteria bacterium]
MKTLNKTIIALSLFVSTLSFAEEAKVEITSFNYEGSRTRIAELCGKVTGINQLPTFVKLLIDEKSDSPAIYNVVVGSETKFCTTVVTIYGTASASLWGQQNTSVAHVKTMR